ncbi:MAG TPA: sigma-70 family RNA polymerase sigma factor [Acidimicrobiia bacterium]|nr:sigma-70 family RNA polymerase sigma factor [Acidimicrobiia bacterium]
MANQETFMTDVDPYLDSLYSTALRLTKKPADAQDLVQESLLKAYKAYERFESGTNLKAWLFRILTNSYINIYRYKKRRPREVDVDDQDTMFLYHKLRGSQAADISDSSEEDFLKTITDTDISTALEELPEQYREVVLLSDVEGLSYAQIAEMLEIPPGTVMSRLHRGRKALQKALWNYVEANNLVGARQKMLAQVASQAGEED